MNISAKSPHLLAVQKIWTVAFKQGRSQFSSGFGTNSNRTAGLDKTDQGRVGFGPLLIRGEERLVGLWRIQRVRVSILLLVLPFTFTFFFTKKKVVHYYVNALHRRKEDTCRCWIGSVLGNFIHATTVNRPDLLGSIFF